MRELVIGSSVLELHLLDLGATTHRLHFGGRNVLLGHHDAMAQHDGPAYLGSTVGRYANRIAGAQFVLDGVNHRLLANEGPHTLHGGPDGFHRRIWKVAEHTETTAVFVLDSPDGDQGFPGNMRCTAAYTVDTSTVTITYTATADQPTIVNIANHAYFNLNGEDSGSIDEHLLTLHAGHFTPVGHDLIPFGHTGSVEGSAMDWRKPKPLRDAELDHNFVIDGVAMRPAARLRSTASGIQLAISTDQPGLQVYTGDQLDGTIVGTGGRRYHRRAGIALEAQHFPDAPNQPGFPSVVLRPGQSYSSVTSWELSIGGRPDER